MKRFGIFLLISFSIILALYALIFPAIGYKPPQSDLFPIGIFIGIVSMLLAQAVFD